MQTPSTVRAALIQTKCTKTGDDPIREISDFMIAKALEQLDAAKAQGAQIACLQEIFNGLYFCPSQDTKWFDAAERIPDGPTTQLMCEKARQLGMVLIVPLFEECSVIRGKFYNAAAVIDADGKYLGKYRKTHIPQVQPGFFEKFYFTPGDLGFPVFNTAVGKVGVYICYDRHFHGGWDRLGSNGAEMVFNPSATVRGLSGHLWKLEQPSAAAANMYFVGALNRPGIELPWKTGQFYGSSYFADPRGEIISRFGEEDADDIVVCDLNLDQVREQRKIWNFFRDRRETY